MNFPAEAFCLKPEKRVVCKESRCKLVLIQFGLVSGCDSALGLKQGVIEDWALSSSSSLDQAHAATQGRLNGSTGWCASDDDKKPSFVVCDLNFPWLEGHLYHKVNTFGS